MKALFASPNAFSLFIMRVILGAVFFPHGAQKALGLFGGKGFSETLSQFSSSGLPWIIGLLVILGEFLGSLALLAGFLTRLAAFGITAIMLGAIIMVHGQHGFFMNWHGSKEGQGFEYHLLAIGLSVALMLAGGGRWSADRAIARQLLD